MQVGRIAKRMRAGFPDFGWPDLPNLSCKDVVTQERAVSGFMPDALTEALAQDL
jgi:hypothetical protein